MDINDAIAALDDQINGLLRIRAGLVALSGQAATDEEGSCDLVGFDPNRKLDAIKMVRWATNLGLREAKAIVEQHPKSLGFMDAHKISALREAGCVVVVRRPL